MKNIIGVLLVIAGIILGLYVGVWQCFIGGIIDVIEALKSETISAMNIALGIAKVVFASAIGWFCAILLIIPGYAMLE